MTKTKAQTIKDYKLLLKEKGEADATELNEIEVYSVVELLTHLDLSKRHKKY